jgi:hypothetical protein
MIEEESMPATFGKKAKGKQKMNDRVATMSYKMSRQKAAPAKKI